MLLARRILIFAALWLVFESVVSWFAFCEQAKNYGGTNQPAPKDGCIFGGPLASSVGAFNAWWHHKFEEPDSYVALFTGVLVIATAALWWSTRQLWRATNDTLKHAEKTAERQLRAYLVVEKCDLHYRDKEPIVTVKVKNCGQTPAERVVIVGSIHVIKRPTTFVVGAFDENLSKGRLGPNLSLRIQLKKKRPLTDEEESGLKDGTHWMVAVGDLEYTDVFGDTWHLNYEFATGGKYGAAIRQGAMSVSTDAKIERKKNA